MNNLQESLAEALEPMVRRLVREEVERAQLQWRWRTVKQAAELLGITENAVYQRINRGQLPTRRRGSRVFIDLDELDRQLR